MKYVIYALKKKRTYIAILLLYSSIVNFIKGNNIVGFICFLIVISLLYSAVSYLLTDPANYVYSWKTLENTRASQNRIKRASEEELDCIKVDKDIRTGYYYGKNGENYTTTLQGCTCMDFKRRGIPCKHMYHLAQQLGYIDIIHKQKK